MRILIMEDDPIIREQLGELLVFEGYDVASAKNGREGVELALATHPDMIISDITMPELDGYGVLRRLQLEPQLASVPFIFLSAKADKRSMRYGMDLGADDYLTKPFTQEELFGAIQARLAKKQRHMQTLVGAPEPGTRTGSPTEPDDPQYFIGKSVHGYHIVEKIGEGGVGTVYRAYQAAIGREVAIKILRRRYAHNTEFLHRFATEAELIARLEHPHIIPLYDYFEAEHDVYIVMRLLRAGSLRSVLSQHGPRQLQFAARLLHQIADALAVTHGVGIIHRDLKPGNILLDEWENVYLTDFGLAKNLLSGESGQTESKRDTQELLKAQLELFDRDPSTTLYMTDADGLTGTPAYLSPEQIRGEPLSPQSDIYSLGITLYEIIVGKPPFEGSMVDIVTKQLDASIPSIHVQMPAIPPDIDRVLQKATAKAWQRRYTDVAQFAGEFRRACGLAES